MAQQMALAVEVATAPFQYALSTRAGCECVSHAFQAPSGPALTAGLRPPPGEPEFHEPGGPRGGWQHEAASRVERQFRTTSVLPLLSPSRRVMLRSQSGPALPSSPLTRFHPALFRVLLQRRLALPLPLTFRSCRCGRPLDAFGHHRAACFKSGVLARRGFAVESAAARVCREAGARVATNLFVRDMDLGVTSGRDGFGSAKREGQQRRLEVVADGLPLFGGVQLALDTTLVSEVQGDGEPTKGVADRDGVGLRRARRCQEQTYPELVQPVVFGLEVGGRWSKEARVFVQLLARAKARSEPPVIQRRMEQAWLLRWLSIISCAVARASEASLLELRGGQGADGQVPPSHEVERETTTTQGCVVDARCVSDCPTCDAFSAVSRDFFWLLDDNRLQNVPCGM